MRALSLLFGLLAACVGQDTKDDDGDDTPLDTDPADEQPSLTVLTRTAVLGEPVMLELPERQPGEAVRVFFGRELAAEPVCEGDVCVDIGAAEEQVSVSADGAGVARVLFVVPDPWAGALHVQLAGPGWRSQPYSVEVVHRITLFGVWEDDFGGLHENDHQRLRDDYGTFHVLTIGPGDTLLARNDAANEYNADLYSRFDWVEHQGAVWYCQAAFDAPTEEAALAASADASDPANSGCGGFPWSRLTPAEPAIAGSWSDSFGGSHVIDRVHWDQSFGVWEVSRFSNDDRVIIGKNGAGNEFFPGLWSRFDWAVVGDDVWYCQTAYDAATEWAARATPAADPTDPAIGGCGGFAWTQLLPM